MIRIIILLFTILAVTSCGSSKVEKIYWQGELIKQSEDINYLYWNDGNQFITFQKDSITVSLAGFEFENAVYILVSLTNNKKYPLTFFTKECKLQYVFEGNMINLFPVKPKNLNPDHFSFFNTIISGAGSISRLFLNIPIDILFQKDKGESNTGHLDSEYQDANINMTKKLFMSNHTLFPDTKYSGFLVFEYDKDQDIKQNGIDIIINFETEFKMQGVFRN